MIHTLLLNDASKKENFEKQKKDVAIKITKHISRKSLFFRHEIKQLRKCIQI